MEDINSSGFQSAVTYIAKETKAKKQDIQDSFSEMILDNLREGKGMQEIIEIIKEAIQSTYELRSRLDNRCLERKRVREVYEEEQKKQGIVIEARSDDSFEKLWLRCRGI